MNSSSLPDIEGFLPSLLSALRSLWFSVDSPLALYLRGSAIDPGETNPWDVDFVLIVGGDKKGACKAADFTSLDIMKRFPDLPPVDISVLCENESSDSFISGVLLLSHSSKLIFGKDFRRSINDFHNLKDRVVNYTVLSASMRVESFDDCNDPIEKNKRAPHLAKSVLRLGGVMRIDEALFSRSPVECSEWLLAKHPILMNDVSVLMESIEKKKEITGMRCSCLSIIKAVAEVK